MARQFNTAQTFDRNEQPQEKAVGFLNFYMPVVRNGKPSREKLGFYPVREGDPVGKAILAAMTKNPEKALEALKGLMAVEYNSATPQNVELALEI